MREALALLTTLGRPARLSSRALRWFPIVGALVGALVGGAWWLTTRWWPPAVAAAIVMVVDLALTGMLHLDGLADSADGLLPHMTRQRRLAVMHTPDVGAFGAAAVGITLLLRFAALATMHAHILLIVALWCASRSLVASVPATVPYAREDGMGGQVLDGAPRWPALCTVLAAVLAGVAVGREGPPAVVIGVVAGIGVIALALRRIGGFTGDVLGATIVVIETVALVVAAAKW